MEISCCVWARADLHRPGEPRVSARPTEWSL